MALIPENEYPVLKSASDVKTVADSAIQDAQTMAIAKLINSSANTGQYSVLYNHEIISEVITTLETEGYTVTRRPASVTAEPKYQYVISWKD